MNNHGGFFDLRKSAILHFWPTPIPLYYTSDLGLSMIDFNWLINCILNGENVFIEIFFGWLTKGEKHITYLITNDLSVEIFISYKHRYNALSVCSFYRTQSITIIWGKPDKFWKVEWKKVLDNFNWKNI